MTALFDAWRDIVHIHKQTSFVDARLGGSPTRDALFAIILAGGSGSRLARLVDRFTGARVPKQYSDFGAARLGGEAPSLLQRTLARIGRHVPERSTHVMIARKHELRASRQLMPWNGAHVHSQIEDCGTAVAVLVALLEILIAQPDATIVITPSDGVVGDAAAFDATLERAIRIATVESAVVLVGTEPSRPLAGQSWLVPFDVGPIRAPAHVLPLARYVECPRKSHAEELRRGGSLIDTMMVVAKGHTLLDLYARVVPRVLRLFLYALSVPTAERSAFVDRAYEGLGQLDLHRDLLALGHGLRIATLPAAAGWMKIETDLQALVWLAGRRHVEPTRWPISPGSVSPGSVSPGSVSPAAPDGARRALP